MSCYLAEAKPTGTGDGKPSGRAKPSTSAATSAKSTAVPTMPGKAVIQLSFWNKFGADIQRIYYRNTFLDHMYCINALFY